MELTQSLSLSLAIATSCLLHAQDDLAEKPAFLTPIAKSMEEAVKLQIIESRTLPAIYETNLFSLGQTIALQTGSEVQATRTVGRNLTFSPSIQLPEEAIRSLVREACLRVPYSGWRENADLLGDRVSKIWIEFAATDAENYQNVTRVIPTEYYKFGVSIQYNDKYGDPPKLTLYHVTNGYQSIYEEMMVELESELGMFARNIADVDDRVLDEPKAARWFHTKLADARNHVSIIDKTTNRWPIAVHLRLANSSREWSIITGERSMLAPDRDALEKAFVKAYKRILTGGDAPLSADLLVVPTADMEQPLLHNGIQLLASRKRVDGMDRLEIRFRYRPQADKPESK